MIYLDASAAVKLAHRETHSEDLVAWLNARADPDLASSTVLEVELHRALRRHDPAALPAAIHVLSRLYRVELSPTIRTMAGTYPYPELRSLDAIHLATAHFLALNGPAPPTFVAYDARLLAFAAAERLPTASPGAAAS